MGEVTVDDAVSWIGRFENGALANLEATRFAGGRKNHITFEINGSKGSLVTFNFEDMNRLGFYNAADPADASGFRDIIVTEGTSPFRRRSWWPPGHIIGYEHTFVHTFVDFVGAVVAKARVSSRLLPTAWRTSACSAAVQESAKHPSVGYTVRVAQRRRGGRRTT